MILKIDANQLEWRVKVLLAQDPVAMAELLDPSRDLHSENQEFFGLPTRTVSKQFLFRMIFADAFGEQGFAGPAYAFSKDNNFSHVSASVKYWTGVVERFFEKYEGVYKHSLMLVETGCYTGKLTSPSGREYEYKQFLKWNGEPEWPRTQMLNHPIQGFSADLMILIRRIIWKQWPYYGDREKALLINTVHDDVEADVVNDPQYVEAACIGMERSFSYLPGMAKKWYGADLNVPFTGEVKFGMNLNETALSKYNQATFLEDFKKYG
jgi:hypothetical protein